MDSYSSPAHGGGVAGGADSVAAFRLPGYDVGELVGYGGSGEVWRARDRASGDIVALKRLRDTGRTGAAEFPDRRLNREAALLASVRHEHVVSLRRVVPTEAGLVLVLDFAEGGSLAALLRARGRLSPGEVVTTAAPLAQALADIHGRGLTHGDVTPGNIVFDGSGKPLLADLGVARLVGENARVAGVTPGFADPAVVAGAVVTPASDIHGLAAACYAALTGAAPYGVPPSGVSSSGNEHDAGELGRRDPLGAVVPGAPAPLVEAIEGGLDPDPRARPDAGAFARALYFACAPEPVRLVPAPGRPVASEATHEVRSRPTPPSDATPGGPLVAADDGGAAPAPRHRLQRPRLRLALGRRTTLALVAVALLAAAAFVAVGWASRERSAAANGAQPSSSASSSASLAAASSASAPAPSQVAVAVAGDPEWIRVMTALDKARDQAFVNADPDALTGVYLATSPALAADRRTLAELVDAGEHARGLGLRLTSVLVETRTPTAVVLAVSDTLPGYDLVGAGGMVAHEEGRGERTWIVTLRAQTGGGTWRIDTIVAG